MAQKEIQAKTSEKLERDEKGRLLPGQKSLNPNGRPEGTFSLVELLKKELQELLPQIKDKDERTTVAKAFVQIALEKAMVRGDVTMIRDIFNRIDGMPKHRVEHTGADEGPIQVNIISFKSAAKEKAG